MGVQTVVKRWSSRLTPGTEAAEPLERPTWAASCLNCAEPLTGPFCANCGQRAVPPHPKLRELAGDAFAELSGWDGKFVETFRLLLLKPGELTRRFIDGQRVRFIAPVRLYLTLSVFYFIAAAAAPEPRLANGAVAGGPVTVGLSAPSQPGAASQAARATIDARSGTLSAAERDSALASIAHAPRIVRPILLRAVTDPTGFKRSVLENMPRVLFVLLPLFAGIVALFCRKRHYPEHLYFALHLHAFVFLALLVAVLARFTPWLPLMIGVGIVAQLSIPVYAFLALRRTYGGTLLATTGRWLGIGTIYFAAGICALFGLAWWAAIAG